MSEWAREVVEANAVFLSRIDRDRLRREPPTGRMVITCMDPRVNLEAIGIPTFATDGSNDSRVAIIRTAGARCPERSLFLALFKADVDEILVLGHTECALVAAHTEITSIIEVMRTRVDGRDFDAFIDRIGASSDEDIKRWIGTIPGSVAGVLAQMEVIRSLPFVSREIAVHGFVYDVDTGEVRPVGEPAG
ncbi:MAG: hypothetical protein M3094_04745 [Actinomycetia bacterium]|nr:hypothetical protein [Actinomycetes bacterium]